MEYSLGLLILGLLLPDIQIRNSRDITTRELASMCDISAAYVCRIENSNRGTFKTTEMRQRIISALRLKAHEQEIFTDLAEKYKKKIGRPLGTNEN